MYNQITVLPAQERQWKRKNRSGSESHPHLNILNKVNYLQFPIFGVLKKEELESFNKDIIIKKSRNKEFLYLPFEKNNYIYFIKKGNVEIGYLNNEGKELTLDILGEGEIFGSSFGVGFSSGYARILGETVLGLMELNIFESYLEKFHSLALKMMKLMVLKMNMLENRLQNMAFKDVKTRICQQLFRLYEKLGDEKSGRIKIPITHQDVAKLVGSTRETASVCLAELKREGVISYQRQRIYIRSKHGLLEYVN